jgi:hypothetical protein
VRPVMEWILELVKDRQLCRLFNWYPVRKYLVRDGEEVQFFDDLECGSDWWEVQVNFAVLSKPETEQYSTQDELGAEGVHIPLIYYGDASLISHFRGKSFHGEYYRYLFRPLKYHGHLFRKVEYYSDLSCSAKYCRWLFCNAKYCR